MSSEEQKFVTVGALITLMNSLVASIKSGVKAQLLERIERLEVRIKQLEEQPLSYQGVHETGKEYRRGEFVTFRGGIWHANDNTRQQPGDSRAWTLAVKHGRDAR